MMYSRASARLCLVRDGPHQGGMGGRQDCAVDHDVPVVVDRSTPHIQRWVSSHLQRFRDGGSVVYTTPVVLVQGPELNAWLPILKPSS